MEEQKQTMDELLTELTEVRTNLKGLQEKERGFKSRKMELEAKIVSTLKQQGIDRVGNDGCTVSIKEKLCPQFKTGTRFINTLFKQSNSNSYKNVCQQLLFENFYKWE